MLRNDVTEEIRSARKLGSRIAARFRRQGLKQELPELHGQLPRPADRKGKTRPAKTLYERGRKYFGAEKTPCAPKDLSAKVKQLVHAKLAGKHSR